MRFSGSGTAAAWVALVYPSGHLLLLFAGCAVLALLAYLAEKPKPDFSMAHWKQDVEAAQLLRGSIENDSI